MFTLLDVAIDFTNNPQTASVQGPFSSAGGFIQIVLQGMIVLGALGVLIFLVWGAFDWITGGGEKGKVDSARNKITGAIIGLIVLASVVAIFNLLGGFLGINLNLNLRPSDVPANNASTTTTTTTTTPAGP